MPPETRYARSPNGTVAYQVFGDGPVDLVFVTQWGTNVDNYWDEPSAARYLDRLASFSRVILFDKRGTGVSDPVPTDNLPTVDKWMEDIQTVMNAAGSQRAAIVGDTEGGSLAIMFAATYPDRTCSFVLINSLARPFHGAEYPIGFREAELASIARMFLDQHGTTGRVVDFTAPSIADDERFRRSSTARPRPSPLRVRSWPRSPNSGSRCGQACTPARSRSTMTTSRESESTWPHG